MLVCSLAMKSKKWLARDVFDTFATDVTAHDITDTDCWARNDIWSWLLFRGFQAPIFIFLFLRFSKQD